MKVYNLPPGIYSWTEVFGQMKARGLGVKDIIRLHYTIDWGNGGNPYNEPIIIEYTYTEVLEQAYNEIIKLLPTKSEVQDYVGEIFDKIPMSSNIGEYLFKLQNFLNNIQ